MPKELVQQDAKKRIKHIQFGVLSQQEIMGMSELEVTTRDMYDFTPEGERKPMEHGVLDRRMGISDKGSLCETCGHKMKECVGHYGYIRLVLPVFHIGFFKHVISILQCICKVSPFLSMLVLTLTPQSSWFW
jgi:DNA-directed RNA polymerase III subunit RPC1